MTTARAPHPVARIGLGLAARALRRPGDRARYRAEFLAELHDLPPGGQLRFTAGVLSQTFALRAALGSSPTRAEEDAMTLTTAQKPFNWRCRLFRKHHYVVRSTEDGGRYRTCVRCGHDWFGNSSINTGGFAAGGL